MTIKECEVALNTLEVSFSILQESDSECTQHFVDAAICLLDARSHLLKHIEECGYKASWSVEYSVWEVSEKVEETNGK